MFTTTLTAAFAFPFIILLSIPLVSLSILTIVFAALILSIRVCLIYFDFSVALIKNYLASFSPASPAITNAPPSSSPRDSRGLYSLQSLEQNQYQHSLDAASVGHRPRRSRSQASHRRRSVGSTSSKNDHGRYHGSPQKSRATTPVSPGGVQYFASGSLDRDFEGVGGWGDMSAAAEHHRKHSGHRSRPLTLSGQGPDSGNTYTTDRAYPYMTTTPLGSPNLLQRHSFMSHSGTSNERRRKSG